MVVSESQLIFRCSYIVMGQLRQQAACYWQSRFALENIELNETCASSGLARSDALNSCVKVQGTDQ